MKAFIKYLIVPAIIATAITLLFGIIVIFKYYPHVLNKYQIASYCLTLETTAFYLLMYIRFFFSYQKIKKNSRRLAEVSEFMLQDKKLRTYIIARNLNKVYVSRKMYHYFFKTLSFAKISPCFFYNKDRIGTTRHCTVIVDPYSKDFDFNMAPKNQIIDNINDLM